MSKVVDAAAKVDRLTHELETERTKILFCEECGCDSDTEARGWEGHLSRRRRTAR